MDMETIPTNSSLMVANGTTQMATDTGTMPTVLEPTCSRTIQRNGTIPMEMVLETTVTGLQAMEHNGKMMITTDLETILMERMAISTPMIHYDGVIVMVMDTVIRKR